jgi:hypothetical protein
MPQRLRVLGEAALATGRTALLVGLCVGGLLAGMLGLCLGLALAHGGLAGGNPTVPPGSARAILKGIQMTAVGLVTGGFSLGSLIWSAGALVGGFRGGDRGPAGP